MMKYIILNLVFFCCKSNISFSQSLDSIKVEEMKLVFYHCKSEKKDSVVFHRSAKNVFRHIDIKEGFISFHSFEDKDPWYLDWFSFKADTLWVAAFDSKGHISKVYNRFYDRNTQLPLSLFGRIVGTSFNFWRNGNLKSKLYFGLSFLNTDSTKFDLLPIDKVKLYNKKGILKEQILLKNSFTMVKEKDNEKFYVDFVEKFTKVKKNKLYKRIPSLHGDANFVTQEE